MQAPTSANNNRTIIKSAAFRLFYEYGYRLTSYSKIAEESGLGRPLVQYYFPKKEDLATEFVLSILQEASLLVDAAPDPLVRATQLGQVYYSFLLADANMHRLTLDLLSSRQVTSRVTTANAEYTIPSFADTEENMEAFRQASIRATGGIYELLFIELEAGRTCDPALLSARNTAAFAAMALGNSYERILKDLKGKTIEPRKVAAICETLKERLFT